MAAEYFLRGLLIGLIFGVPAGAIGALTIQYTLERGFFSGFITGLGSSAADLLYACVGIFGITIISDFLTTNQTVIRLVGGVFILVLGIQIFRKKKPPSAIADTKNRPVLCFLSAFSVAVLNPATIVSFLVAFTAFGIEGHMNTYQGVQLILGILFGTLCWWALLSGTVALFRKRVTDKIYQWMNWILGCFMTLFGIVMMLQGIFQG